MGTTNLKRWLLAAVLLAINTAFAGENDLTINQRNSTDTANINRTLASPLTDGLLFYNTSTLLPGYVTLGTGLSISSGVLSASTGAAQVNSDWNSTTGLSKILNRPTLATVAMTGQAGDLTGLATVATTGAYTDLTSKPTIPAAQVNSDWNAVSGLAQILNKPSIPAAMTVGNPNARTVALATAYQCTDTNKPCVVIINLNSTASLTLGGGTTVVGEVRLGSTNGVATGSGVAVGAYKNSLTGTLVVGLAINSDSYNTITIMVPTGQYFAVRQTTGTGLVVVSAYDQSVSN